MAMMKQISVLAALILLLSCGREEDKVLPKEKMGKLLWEVSAGGSYITGYILPNNPSINQAAVSNQMLDHILKINKVNKKQFDNSLEFYKNHPKELKLILDSITARKKRIIDADTAWKKRDSLPGTQPLTPKAL